LDTSRYVNPYIAGSPVTGTEMFFGREDVFSFVRRNLTGRHRDTPIVLYGQRRTGKTSVLYQMHRHLDSRYRCVFIDMHGLSLDGVGNLLWGIANSIRRGLQRDHQLTIPVPDRSMFSADPYLTFEGAFLDGLWPVLGDDHLVLLIDEVVRLDEEMRSGQLEREVFDYLRHLMQHFENLNFIFSIGSGLEELEKEYAFLFSVSLYHRISFLEASAAHALITQPIAEHYVVLPAAVKGIVDVTSGHPYYTQLLCHCMFDRWMRSPKAQMTPADVEAVLTETIELGSPNLMYVWEDSTPEEQGILAGMAAAMQARQRPVTIDEIRQVWRQAGVSLPEGIAASAIRSLTSREVVAEQRGAALVTGSSSGANSFTVDLQRIWIQKHRPLDWVREEIAEAAQEWERYAKPAATAVLSEPNRRDADVHPRSGSAGATENAIRDDEAVAQSTQPPPRAVQAPGDGESTKVDQPLIEETGPPPPARRTAFRQIGRLSPRGWIFGGAFFGIILMAVLIAVVLANSHATAPPAGSTSAASPSTILKDGFSSSANGWTVVGNGASGRYSNGKYQVNLEPIKDAYAYVSPSTADLNPAPSDITIDISAYLIDGTDQYSTGIICRSNPSTDTNYQFLISENYAEIDKYMAGDLRTLFGASTNLVHNHGKNQLRASCTNVEGQNAVHLVFWVNGEKVEDTIDLTDPIIGGTVGIAMERHGASGVVKSDR